MKKWALGCLVFSCIASTGEAQRVTDIVSPAGSALREQSAQREGPATLAEGRHLPSAPTFMVNQRQPCDPERIRSAESAAKRGRLFMFAGPIVLLAGRVASFNQQGSTVSLTMLGGVGLTFYGWHLRFGRGNKSAGWDEALQHLTPGVSTSSEIIGCLGEPNSKTTSGDSETWFYSGGSQGIFRASSIRTVRLTVRNRVLANIERSATTFD